MFYSQEPNAEQRAQRPLLLPRHAQPAYNEQRQDAHSGVGDDADDGRGDEVGAFVEADVVVRRRPHRVHLVPEGVERAAVDEEHEREDDAVNDNEADEAAHDVDPRHGHAALAQAPVEHQNGDLDQRGDQHVAAGDGPRDDADVDGLRDRHFPGVAVDAVVVEA